MHRRVTDILIVFLLFLFSCSFLSGEISVTDQTPKAVALPSATPDALVLDVQGEVNVRQVITGQTVMASFGDYLRRGDVITAGQAGRAEVLCSDGAKYQVDANNQSETITCGETPDPVYQQIILQIHQGQIQALPSVRVIPSDVPVILSPRDTRITDGQPTIHWLPVEGAESYEVIMSGLKSELWRATTQESRLPYPEGQPSLEPEITYIIEVIAEIGEPVTEFRSLETAWVTLISAAEVEKVRQFETQIEALDLSPESTRFLKAVYYADLELYDAALTELVSLAKETTSPLPHRMLGDVYLTVKLDGEAAQSFETARQLAQEQDNSLVEAEAEVGQGHVAYATQDFAGALNHYQTALTLYQELGLESQADVVAEFVTKTQGLRPTPTP